MSTETWTPVEPLTDDDLNQRYWREPKVGDRVRVRLSGECQLEGPVLNIETRKTEHGRHPEFIDGQYGTVIVCHHCGSVSCDLYEGHPFRVRLDERLGNGPHFAAYLAPSELEILP